MDRINEQSFRPIEPEVNREVKRLTLSVVSKDAQGQTIDLDFDFTNLMSIANSNNNPTSDGSKDSDRVTVNGLLQGLINTGEHSTNVIEINVIQPFCPSCHKKCDSSSSSLSYSTTPIDTVGENTENRVITVPISTVSVTGSSGPADSCSMLSLPVRPQGDLASTVPSLGLPAKKRTLFLYRTAQEAAENVLLNENEHEKTKEVEVTAELQFQRASQPQPTLPTVNVEFEVDANDNCIITGLPEDQPIQHDTFNPPCDEDIIGLDLSLKSSRLLQCARNVEAETCMNDYSSLSEKSTFGSVSVPTNSSSLVFGSFGIPNTERYRQIEKERIIKLRSQYLENPDETTDCLGHSFNTLSPDPNPTESEILHNYQTHNTEVIMSSSSPTEVDSSDQILEIDEDHSFEYQPDILNPQEILDLAENHVSHADLAQSVIIGDGKNKHTPLDLNYSPLTSLTAPNSLSDQLSLNSDAPISAAQQQISIPNKIQPPAVTILAADVFLHNFATPVVLLKRLKLTSVVKQVQKQFASSSHHEPTAIATAHKSKSKLAHKTQVLKRLKTKKEIKSSARAVVIPKLSKRPHTSNVGSKSNSMLKQLQNREKTPREIKRPYMKIFDITTDRVTGLKTYTCKICGAKIRQMVTESRKCNEHYKLHKRPERFNCNKCTKKYEDTSSLVRHQKEKHPEMFH